MSENGSKKLTDRASEKTIARLCIYRRLLGELLGEKTRFVYSHQLADAAGVSAAQVRRDMMAVGFTGSPTKGYEVAALLEAVGDYLDAPDPQGIALVGVGNLGRAILAYFTGRRPKLGITAAFDRDPHKTGRVIHGCRVYDVSELGDVLSDNHIRAAALAVPATEAQKVAERLVSAGVRGILNFAPAHLRVPPTVHVENVDITTLLEKVAFFARAQETE